MTSLLRHARRSFSWPFPSEATDPYGLGAASFFPTTGTWAPNRELPMAGFTQLVDGGLRGNSVVFACEQKRISVFSEARFMWRGFNKGRPGPLFSTPDLQILETPWARATTSDLLAEILVYADFGGNAYIHRPAIGEDRLRVLRPDWVTIVMGDSSGNPVESPSQLDCEILGFIYDPQDGKTQPEVLLADEVAHFIPPGLRDPLSRFRGMSWVTPVVRELQADQAATMHKLRFFDNGATPQMVVTFDASVGKEQFEAFVGKMDESHAGWRNAYRTLYLGGGADVTVVGKDLQQLDFSNTQGRGETRIASASGIHPVLVPLSEGLQGSSLNAGNFSSARRSTADMTFRPLWRNVCGSLAAIVPPPSGSELWFDEAGIAFLREDQGDAAEIQYKQSQTIRNLLDSGYKPESVVAAVEAQDWSLLQHTGLFSVQLQKPMADQPALPPATNGNGAVPPPAALPAAN